MPSVPYARPVEHESDISPAQARWRSQLMSWAIPDHIKAQTSVDPWRLDPTLFRPTESSDKVNVSLAAERALDLLGDEKSVLDVGCGGGAAAFALAPPAKRLHGVDQSHDMLAVFSDVAAERSLAHETTTGSWLEVAPRFNDNSFDVVVCHHVAYNVADIGPFVAELWRVARNGVVLELTMAHPQTSNNPLWEQFWDLTRPVGPTALDAAAAITEYLNSNDPQHRPSVTLEVGQAGVVRQDPPWEARVEGARRMLCLPPDRSVEVSTALQGLAPRSTERAVIVVR